MFAIRKINDEFRWVRVYPWIDGETLETFQDSFWFRDEIVWQNPSEHELLAKQYSCFLKKTVW